MVDAVGYNLDVMTPKEAKRLLIRLIDGQLIEKEEKKIQDLANTVGYLPLALILAAAQLNNGASIAKLILDLQAEIAQLSEKNQTDGFAQKQDYCLLACLNLTMRQLPLQKLQNFAWLGVLPENATITEKMAATLWECDLQQARDTLQYLHSRGLLLSETPTELPPHSSTEIIHKRSNFQTISSPPPQGQIIHQENKNENPTYHLHQFIGDLARNLISAPTTSTQESQLMGLGLTLKEAHRQILLRYQKGTRNNLWHTLEDDGYIHSHLIWHLEKAGWTDVVHQLLQEETEEGQNGWYRACERLGKTTNYVKDVARAWELAEEEFEKKPDRAIGLQCRYALIISSLNSWQEKIPAKLMAELVEKQVFTPAQGLVYALQAEEPSDRATAIGKLAPYLPQSLLPKALEAATGIGDIYYRAIALNQLAPYLPESLLREVLEAAKAIQSESDRVIAINELFPHLPESLLPKALETIIGIESESDRVRALSELAPHLPKSLIPEALKAARNIRDNYHRVLVLSELAPHQLEIIPEALEAARNIPDPYYRASVLSDLAPHLPEYLFSEVLEAVKGIQDPYYQASVLSDLAPHLPECLLQEALDTAKNLESDEDRAQVLSELAPRLPISLLSEVLEIAKSIQSESDRSTTIRELSSHLPACLLSQALMVVREIKDNYYRAITLSDLATYLPEILPEALEVAKSIQLEGDRASALSKLAPHLPDSLLPEVLEAAKSIDSESERAKILSELAPYLSESLLIETLDAAKKIVTESDRVRVLSELISYLPDSLLPEVLKAAREVVGEADRAIVLNELAPYLPESLLPEIIEAAKSISSESDRASVLSKLAPYLRESLLLEVLQAGKSMLSESDRASVLSELIPYLPESLLPEVLEATKAIIFESNRARVLKEVTLQFESYGVNSALLWQEMLHALADLRRIHLLPNLAALSSVIVSLGGTEALAETARAILEVERWWP